MLLLFYRFSLIAIQDVHDVTALKLICDELNKPSLRRVSEWKDNSHSWNYCLSDIHCMLSQNAPGIGFIYDAASTGAETKFVSLKELPMPEVKIKHTYIFRLCNKCKCFRYCFLKKYIKYCFSIRLMG